LNGLLVFKGSTDTFYKHEENHYL